jgi:hypothetical protein
MGRNVRSEMADGPVAIQLSPTCGSGPGVSTSGMIGAGDIAPPKALFGFSIINREANRNF